MYWTLFKIFFKIGTFTIGGGAAMIPLIEREIVDKHHFLDSREFLDMISIAQSAPGIIAVNVSIFVGNRIAGLKGSIIATLGSILAPFLTILAIASIFTTFSSNRTVEAIFKGIRPAVVALIAVPSIRMAVKNRLTALNVAIILLSVIFIACIGISPVWIIVTAILMGICKGYYELHKNKSAGKK